MLYTEFKSTLVKDIRKYFSDCEVKEAEVTKSNDRHYDGICVTPKNSKVGPTVYANLIYRDYLESEENYPETLYKTIRIYEEALDNLPDPTGILDFEHVRPRLKIRLIDPKTNESFLKNMAYKMWCDLAVSFIVDIADDRFANVSNDLCKAWGKTVDDLYDVAISNMESAPVSITDLNTIFGSIVPLKRETDLKVYTLTDGTCFGSCAVLLKSAMNRCAEIMKCDKLIILPSSIHEVIVLDQNQFDGSEEFIRNIILDVNDRGDKKLVLSDHPYYYDTHTEEYSF